MFFGAKSFIIIKLIYAHLATISVDNFMNCTLHGLIILGKDIALSLLY